jgi:hypothetical protein
MQLTPAVMYGVFVAGTTVAVLLLAYLLYRHLSKTAGPMEVCALYIYPVKSCAGIQLTECQFDRLGFQHDRRFVVLNSETGNMVSQREYPQMALITPKIDAASNTLTLSFPGEKEVIELPLETKQGEKDTKEAKVTVWYVAHMCTTCRRTLLRPRVAVRAAADFFPARCFVTGTTPSNPASSLPPPSPPGSLAS